jgi:hypothetical protein
MLVRPTGTMGLIGLRAESSSALARGMAGMADGAAVGVGDVVVGAMDAAVGVTAVGAMATDAAVTATARVDMLDAGMQVDAATGVASVEVVDSTAERAAAFTVVAVVSMAEETVTAAAVDTGNWPRG